jgi:2-polyprenyl-3-methyl-5-hydroxy-6-metoxy-1,4-benzoquinol methylase
MSEDSHIETPPAGLEGWREVWQKRLSYRGPAGIRGWLRRLTLRLLGADFDRQRDFNLAVLDLLDGLRGDLIAVREGLQAHLDQNLRGLDDRLVTGIRRNDALVTVLDQKIEGLAARIRDIATPMLTGAAPLSPSFRDDYLYRRFEDAARGTSSELGESARELLPLFREHAPLLDVGCGRGEILELCREAGIEARGIDVNERSVADLQARGLAAQIGAVPDHLESIEPASVGTVYAAHVVEHLPIEPLLGLLTGSWRVLRPGGILVIETPNAQSLMMSGSEFWKDPSHLAPRHPAALVILGRELGFEVAEMKTMHPFDESMKLTIDSGQPEDLLRLVDRLNELLFGHQDLRLILAKPLHTP